MCRCRSTRATSTRSSATPERGSRRSCVNALERPTTGSVFVGDQDMTQLRGKELLAARQRIGMVFQQFNLLKSRSIYKNIAYPLRLAGLSESETIDRVEELLEFVGLSDKALQYPSQLSGGQKQRLSIALALIGTPDIVVLDELTTGVDPEGRREVWRLVEDFKDQGVTFILVSHDLDETNRLCDRFTIIADGRTRFVGTSDELVRRYPAPSPSRWTLEDSYVAFLNDARQQEGTNR